MSTNTCAARESRTLLKRRCKLGQIDSVNGSVTVRIPSAADADVTIETLNGGISDDFGFHVEKGEFVGRSVKERLGAGGARLAVDTVNGRVAIRTN